MIKKVAPDGMVLSWFRNGLSTHEIGARLSIKEHIIAKVLNHERNAEYNAAVAAKSQQPLAGDKAGADVQVPGIHIVEDCGTVGCEGADRQKKDHGEI